MKKGLFALLLIIIGSTLIFSIGCEEDTEEVCLQDEIQSCSLEDGGFPTVTYCSPDGEEGYYTYNGTDYPDNDQGMVKLYADLGCQDDDSSTTKSSKELKQCRDLVIGQLIALKEETIILSRNQNLK
ncbi:MAG: hypothetical protein R6U66_04165 [Bacteroidales bacterium]